MKKIIFWGLSTLALAGFAKNEAINQDLSDIMIKNLKEYNCGRLSASGVYSMSGDFGSGKHRIDQVGCVLTIRPLEGSNAGEVIAFNLIDGEVQFSKTISQNKGQYSKTESDLIRNLSLSTHLRSANDDMNPYFRRLTTESSVSIHSSLNETTFSNSRIDLESQGTLNINADYLQKGSSTFPGDGFKVHSLKLTIAPPKAKDILFANSDLLGSNKESFLKGMNSVLSYFFGTKEISFYRIDENKK